MKIAPLDIFKCIFTMKVIETHCRKNLKVRKERKGKEVKRGIKTVCRHKSFNNIF
jgi:hypothetical protein